MGKYQYLNFRRYSLASDVESNLPGFVGLVFGWLCTGGIVLMLSLQTLTKRDFATLVMSL